MKNLKEIIIGLLLSLLVIICPVEYLSPLIIILGGLILGMLVISLVSPEDQNFLFLTFLIGFILRIASSVVFSFLHFLFSKGPWGYGFLIGDGYSYSYTGWEIAQLWQRGMTPSTEAILHFSGSGVVCDYDFWNAFVYFFSGNSPFTMFFINSFFGAFAVILVYLITKRIFNKKAAMIASLFCAFWPSLFLWSTQNLKEPISLFSILLAIFSIVNLYSKFKPIYFFTLLLSIFFLFKIRTFILIPLFSAVILSILLSFRKSKIFILYLILFFIVISTLIPSLQNFQNNTISKYKNFLLVSSFEKLNENRRGRASYGGSSFSPNTDISSLPKALKFLPIGFFFAIFAPFPWQVGSFLQLIAIPEMLIWYPLLFYIFRGIKLSIKYGKMRISSVMIFFILIFLVALSLGDGNIGTMFRHRAMMLPLCFIFAAGGLTAESKE